MVGCTKERGLSEVIGFLMIVALLGILFSMYLLYVVPIQGKDAEIAHMKYVTQQFIDLKSDIDSLIINERVNMPIARSFELGTLASSGQGALSIIPIQGFIEAAGTLVVNQQMDFLTVQGNFLELTEPLPVANLQSRPNNIDSPAQWIDNGHLFFNYPGVNSVNNTINGSIHRLNYTYSIISNTTYTNITKEKYGKYVIHPEKTYSLEKVLGASIEWSNFSSIHEYNPNITSYVNNTSNTIDYFAVKPQTDIVFDFYNWTDQTQNDILEYRRTLQENATSEPHFFDLSKINEITTTDPNLLEFNLMGTTTDSVGAPVWSNIVQSTQPLGSLQYWSQNRYWINQELLYEMGGLFLKQNEGVSIMLIPSLAVTPVTTSDGGNIKVSLVDVTITDTNDVSGSKSAQVFSKVDSVVKDQLREVNGGQLTIHTLSSDIPNTKFLIITFTPQNANDVTTTRLWKRAFDQVYVITQKTMSDREITDYPYATSMTTLYDEADPAHPTASLIIGKDVIHHLTGVANNLAAYTTRLQNCANGNHQASCPNEGLTPFFFDYSKARVSLVIQSGAL